MPNKKAWGQYDLRQYLNELQAIGELQKIEKEVDWNLEIGAIIRRSYDLCAPAPLFENIKGCPDFRVLGAPAAASQQPQLFLSRPALSLGLSPKATSSELIQALSTLLEIKPIPPKIVDTGLVKENILVGDQVDLEKLPSPQINSNDGGRYLNTWGTIVSKTPDGKWVNWGIARVMLLDKTRCVANVVPGQDTRKIRDQWFEKGEPMPFAVFQGGHPMIPFVSGFGIPEGVSERDVIGGYLGEPLELVKCETVDLEVPANAEIVIEGTFSPTETATEGPMGEFSGSICLAAKNQNPVMNITAMTYRDDAILPVVAGGYPIEENHSCWALGISAKIYSDLKKKNLPVTSCFIPFESAVHWLVVTVDRNYIHQQKEAGTYSSQKIIDGIKDVLFTTKPGIWMTKILIVTDDIDPCNINDIVWAFSTRCRPEGHQFYPNQDLPMPLVLFLTNEEKEKLKCTKVIYNCLRPDDFTQEEIPTPAKFETNWPKEMQEKVLKNWADYGYSEN